MNLFKETLLELSDLEDVHERENLTGVSKVLKPFCDFKKRKKTKKLLEKIFKDDYQELSEPQLSEAPLGPKGVQDVRYFGQLLDKIERGELITIGAKGDGLNAKGNIIIKDEDGNPIDKVLINKNQHIEELINFGRSHYEKLKGNKEIFQTYVGDNPTPVNISASSIFKGQFTQKEKLYGGTNTDLGERLFVFALDSLVNKGKILNIDEYKPSKYVKDDDIISDIENMKSFAYYNPDWLSAAILTAETVHKNTNVSGYEIHHKTKLFNSIKTRGVNLAKQIGKNLERDKWNPSDVFLVKAGITKDDLQEHTNLEDYNNYIGAHDDVIGLSLKKEEGAYKGAIALNSWSKYSGINFKPRQLKDFSKKDLNIVLDALDKLKSLSSSTNIPIRVGFGNYSAPSEFFSDIVEGKVENLGKYWLKSYPGSIDFLSACLQSEYDFDELLEQGLSLAFSESPLSCRHYVAMPSSFEESKHLNEYKVTEVVLDLTTTSACVSFTKNGVNHKAQMRSKGSAPQLTVLKTTYNLENAQPIESVKISKL